MIELAVNYRHIFCEKALEGIEVNEINSEIYKAHYRKVMDDWGTGKDDLNTRATLIKKEYLNQHRQRQGSNVAVIVCSHAPTLLQLVN